jgi:hypothetical protein
MAFADGRAPADKIIIFCSLRRLASNSGIGEFSPIQIVDRDTAGFNSVFLLVIFYLCSKNKSERTITLKPCIHIRVCRMGIAVVGLKLATGLLTC